jgi:pimeloyl-ACP methyl ester carboxylesterase
MPVVVVHGGPDFDHGYLLPELGRLAARIANALPQGRLIVLPGCGHVLLLECPEETIAAITGFLRGSGVRA